MSIFEDLVEELKEENLLEETIIESSLNEEDTVIVSSVNDEVKANENLAVTEEKEEIVDDIAAVNESIDENLSESEEVLLTPDLDESLKKDSESESKEDNSKKEKVSKKKPLNEKDFYRQRAMDEVMGLQMVEHVLSGVEREQMKSTPKSYDDLKVKQALHSFLQLADDVKSPEHAQAEFQLMQETEDWYSSLTRRDKNISVANLRRFCETTKPSLSSQALMALARFYRNSPFSENVRSKFDLVVTKLFSKEVGNEKREMVFECDELVDHLKELYADWSSVPLYSMDDDDSDMLLVALKFQDFISESNDAEDFDELVKKDFFKRLKVFKEKTQENFFAPMLVAAAVESNIAVGNRYIELLEQEREKADVKDFEDKYGVLHDKSISEATSKTLQLVEILKEKKPVPVKEENPVQEDDNYEEDAVNTAKKVVSKKSNNKIFGANKWLVLGTAATIVLGLFYFAFSSFLFESPVPKAKTDAKSVNLEDTSLNGYVQSGRITKETMFGITTEEWSKLSFTNKQDVLKKFLTTGDEKGFKKVHLLNSSGETVGFASADGINIIN